MTVMIMTKTQFYNFRASLEIHFSTLEFLIFIKNFYKHMVRKLKKVSFCAVSCY
jgi:hypothetical protein